MSPTASSSRSSRSPNPAPKSMPKASCSRSNQPPPRPRTAGRRDRWSRVVASLAVRPGLRNVLAATSRPRRTCRSARPAPTASPSPRAWGRPGRPRRRAGGRRSRASPSRPLRGQTGVAQVRPVRPVDPECRSEPHETSAPKSQGPDSTGRSPRPAAILGQMEAVSRRSFNSRLFRWHQARRRPLLIREAADPWQVLVAEVMSQQTGIERVGPAWRRFVDRWPTPADLAAAGTHELLAAWAGLGYNRRALALRECARKIVADHGGRVPADGRRTGCRCPGSVPTRRERSRPRLSACRSRRSTSTSGESSRGCSACRRLPRDSRLRRTIWCRAVEPGRWLDAVMDLASGTCTARAPLCEACPVADLVRFARGGRCRSSRKPPPSRSR